MRKSVVSGVVLALLMLTAAPVSAGTMERVTGITTVVAVSFDPLILATADCDVLKRLVKHDGTATEDQKCELTGEFFLFDPNLPEGQKLVPCEECGPPTKRFVDEGGACIWSSDYWWSNDIGPVYADSFRITISKKGKVKVVSTYPAVPLECDAG